MVNKSRVSRSRFSFSMILFIFSVILHLSNSEEGTAADFANNNPDFDDQENTIVPTSLQTLLNEEVQNFEAPTHIKKNFPYYLSGFDEDSRPLWVLEFGKYDVRRIVEGGGKNFTDFDIYANQLLFRILNSTTIKSTAENPVTDFSVIIDLEGYDLLQISSMPTVSYVLRKLSQWLVAFERLDTAFCLNANFVAESLINVAKPVLGSIFDKLQVHGTNRDKWMPKILKALPKDQIAEWYGGPKDFVPLKVFG